MIAQLNKCFPAALAILYTCLPIRSVNCQTVYSSSQILKKLIEKRSALSNVTIRAESTEYRIDPADNQWKATGARNDVTATVDTLPRSKFKISYDPAVSIWKQGVADFYETHHVAAFNGRYFVDAISAEGPEGHASPHLEAVIEAIPPDYLVDGRLFTGEEFTTQFAQVFGSSDLISLLRTTNEKFITFDVVASSWTEIPCVLLKVDFKLHNSVRSEKFWLDPMRDFALVHRERTLTSSDHPEYNTVETYDITKFSQGGELTFPTEETYIRLLDGKPVAKTVVHSSVVRINTEEKDRPYDVDLKPGYYVEDHRIGVKFKVGDSLTNQSKLSELSNH